jgi:hypothetical protein
MSHLTTVAVGCITAFVETDENLGKGILEGSALDIRILERDLTGKLYRDADVDTVLYR